MKDADHWCETMSIKVHNGHCLTFFVAGSDSNGRKGLHPRMDNPRGACACCPRGQQLYNDVLAKLKKLGVSVMLPSTALTELRAAAKGDYAVRTGNKRVTWSRASHQALLKEGCLDAGPRRSFTITDKGRRVLEFLETVY